MTALAEPMRKSTTWPSIGRKPMPTRKSRLNSTSQYFVFKREGGWSSAGKWVLKDYVQDQMYADVKTTYRRSLPTSKRTPSIRRCRTTKSRMTFRGKSYECRTKSSRDAKTKRKTMSFTRGAMDETSPSSCSDTGISSKERRFYATATIRTGRTSGSISSKTSIGSG
jgi:hypothetical protein